MTDSEEENLICKICSKVVADGESAVFCEGKCQSWYHISCVNISSQQYKKIAIAEKMLIWMCKSCKKDFKCFVKHDCCAQEMRKTIDEELKKIILEKLNGIYENVSSKIQEVIASEFNKVQQTKPEIKNAEKKKYSEVTREVVVIKPKNLQESKVTKRDVQKYIKPDELEV